jgi:hypothetical protein
MVDGYILNLYQDWKTLPASCFRKLYRGMGSARSYVVIMKIG